MPGEATRRRYSAVFISPHLDDAVFSCGGAIARLRQQGQVLVINLFTQYLADLKIHGAVLGAERYREEEAAARFLDFESLNLGELDAPFRRESYRQLGNLFRLPVQQDIDWLPTLRARLLALLSEIEFEHLYVPLGIGWHVDHVLSHQVFDCWAGEGRLLYYEDAPYCCIPHATRYRLNDIAVCPEQTGDRSLASADALQAWRQAATAYANTALMKNLQPWIVRKFAVPTVSFYLFRLMAQHRHQAIRAVKRRLQSKVVPITDEFERKVDAMGLYRSQFGEFFASRQDCCTTLKTYGCAMGEPTGMVERFWF